MAEDKLLNVEIITPESVLYSGKALSVSVPGSKSPFQVLYNHAPIVSTLELGEIKIVDDSQKKLFFASSPGFTEVRKNKVSILVETAINADSIDPEKVKSELNFAMDKIKSARDNDELNNAKKERLVAENRLKVYQKYSVK